MLIAGLVVIGLGVVIVLIGVGVSIVEWRSGPRTGGRRRSNAAADIEALRRLLEELRSHPFGTQLIVWGIVLILIGGGLVGASRV